MANIIKTRLLNSNAKVSVVCSHSPNHRNYWNKKSKKFTKFLYINSLQSATEVLVNFSLPSLSSKFRVSGCCSLFAYPHDHAERACDKGYQRYALYLVLYKKQALYRVKLKNCIAGRNLSHQSWNLKATSNATNIVFLPTFHVLINRQLYNFN